MFIFRGIFEMERIREKEVSYFWNRLLFLAGEIEFVYDEEVKK